MGFVIASAIAFHDSLITAVVRIAADEAVDPRTRLDALRYLLCSRFGYRDRREAVTVNVGAGAAAAARVSVNMPIRYCAQCGDPLLPARPSHKFCRHCWAWHCFLLGVDVLALARRAAP